MNTSFCNLLFKMLHSIERAPTPPTFPMQMNILTVSNFLLFQLCFRISLKRTWKIGTSWLPLGRTNHRIDTWVWEGQLLFPKHPFTLFEYFPHDNNNNYNFYKKSFKYNISSMQALKLKNKKQSCNEFAFLGTFFSFHLQALC